MSSAAAAAIKTMAEPKVELSAENLDIVDVSKVAKLPEWLQKGLPTLTRGQLKTLGAALGE